MWPLQNSYIPPKYLGGPWVVRQTKTNTHKGHFTPVSSHPDTRTRTYAPVRTHEHAHRHIEIHRTASNSDLFCFFNSQTRLHLSTRLVVRPPHTLSGPPMKKGTENKMFFTSPLVFARRLLTTAATVGNFEQ